MGDSSREPNAGEAEAPQSRDPARKHPHRYGKYKKTTSGKHAAVRLRDARPVSMRQVKRMTLTPVSVLPARRVDARTKRIRDAELPSDDYEFDGGFDAGSFRPAAHRRPEQPEDEKWAAARPGIEAQFFAHAEVLDDHAAQTAASRARLWTVPGRRCAECCVHKRGVLCITLECSFRATIPHIVCGAQGCGSQSAEPFQNGFFPLTPQTSLQITSGTPDSPDAVWLDIGLLRLLEFAQYHSKGLVSDHALANALCQAQKRSTPTARVQDIIKVVHLTFRAMKRYISIGLREARYLAGKVTQAVREAAFPAELAGSKLADCRICCTGLNPDLPLQIPPQAAGGQAQAVAFSEQVPVRPVSLGMDGMMKVKKLQGTAQRSDPNLHDQRVPASIFMTDAERDERDESIADILNVPSTERVCNSFRAERGDTQKRNVSMERTGIFGLMCDHLNIHRAVMMTKGENWRLATMLLEEFLENGICRVAGMYDIGCVYQKQFRRYIALKRETLHPNVIQAAEQMLFPVPPFHGPMQQASCRRENGLLNPRFPGFINPAGEKTEEVWALLGPCPRVKYMTAHHGKMYLDASLVYLNGRNDEGVALNLKQRVARLERLWAATLQLLGLSERAVQRLPAAIQAEEDEEDLPWQLEEPHGTSMVLLRCELKALEASANAPVPPELVCPGSKKSTADRIKKLRASLDKERQSMDRDAVELLELDDPRFLALLLAVAHHKMLEASRAALDGVGAILQIRYHFMKQANPVGALTKLQKQAVRSSGSVRAHLTTVLMWTLTAKRTRDQLKQDNDELFLEEHVPSYTDRVLPWLENRWVQRTLTGDAALAAAVEDALTSLLSDGLHLHTHAP